MTMRRLGSVLPILACGAFALRMPPKAHAMTVQDAEAWCPGPSANVAGAGARNADLISIGITYFAGRSRFGDEAHLATALSTELERELLSARFPAPRGRQRSAPAKLLNVRLSSGVGLSDLDLSMTGSVFREDTLLVTTVKVTRTSDGSVFWSGSQTRSILELPILARLIAEDVAKRVGAQLTTPVPRAVSEKSTQVYELILRGSFLRSRYAPDELEGSIEYLDRALGLNSSSTIARDARETAGLRLLAWGGKDARVESRLASQGLLKRVLDRDRDESETLVDEADAEMRDLQDAHACKLLNSALDRDGRSSPAYALRSLLRARAGRVREAFADAETVTQLGRPFWGSALHAIVLRRSGDLAGARQESTRLAAAARARRGALPFWDARLLATALTQAGDFAGGQAALARVNRDDPRLAWTRGDPLLQAPVAATRRPRR